MNWRNRRSYAGLLLLVIILVLVFSKPADLPVVSVAWRRQNVPVLLYHKVSPSPADGSLGLRLTPKTFDTQMGYLKKRGYTAISVDRLLDHWNNGYPLPPRPIVITFDDGYMDNYLFAFPVLKKYRFTATVFLVSNQIGGYNEWDAGKSGHPRLKLMDLSQIREMQDYGITFGAHTLTHASLTTVPPEDARREIAQCKTLLEKSLGTPVRYLAYPYGRSSSKTEKMARDAGYGAAFSTAKGKNTMFTNRYRLRRLGVDGRQDLADFARMIE